MHACEPNNSPLVSVIIPTYNRRRYLPIALASALNQDYRNIEVIVINDGGENVTDIIAAAADPRIRFIDRRENRGKPASLNEALAAAAGLYVAYLDDDDLWYPNHISTLVSALESSGASVAYSDLYKTYCRIESDGSRTVLSKKIEVSRDFDRFLMLHFNHVLHVSLMHRRDLIEKTGPYNESLNVLIDWDMTRRLAFFCDFLHVRQITGEFYAPVEDCDRISVQRRKNKPDYLRNVYTIRTSRPPRPWPAMKDVSLIFIPQKFDAVAAATLQHIWMFTFYPYQVFLPWTRHELDLLNSEMPNVIHVEVPNGSDYPRRIDAALAVAEGDFAAVIPSGMDIREMWLEKSLWPLLQGCRSVAYELGNADPASAAIAPIDIIRKARTQFPALDLNSALKACGLQVRRPVYDEMPFKFDDAYNDGLAAAGRFDWIAAANSYLYAADKWGNQLWMNTLAANALLNAGRYEAASAKAAAVNAERPTVDSLLTEARARKKLGDWSRARQLLQEARQILEGNNILWA